MTWDSHDLALLNHELDMYGFPLCARPINIPHHTLHFHNQIQFNHHHSTTTQKQTPLNFCSMMGIRLPFMVHAAKQTSSSFKSNVPKGHVAVYVGELQNRVPYAENDNCPSMSLPDSRKIRYVTDDSCFLSFFFSFQVSISYF